MVSKQENSKGYFNVLVRNTTAKLNRKSMNSRRCFRLILLISCLALIHWKVGAQELKTIDLSRQAPPDSLSKLFNIDDFVVLENPKALEMKNTFTNLKFMDGRIVLFQNQSPYENILVFEEESGKLQTMFKSGKYKKEWDDSVKGFMNLTINPESHSIKVIAAADKQIEEYSLDGNLIGSMPSYQFGSHIEGFDGGVTVIYNEFSNTDSTGLNHLVYYDSLGKVIHRRLPYGLDDPGFSFGYITGFMASDGDEIWLNTPWSDTLFKVTDTNLYPQFLIRHLTNSLSEYKGMSLIDITQNGIWPSFLIPGFFHAPPFSIFSIQEGHRINIYVYEERFGKVIKIKNSIANDPLYDLFQVGHVFPKTEQQFAFVIPAWRMNWILRKGKLQREALEKLAPGLYETATTQKGIALVLYVSFNPKFKF